VPDPACRNPDTHRAILDGAWSLTADGGRQSLSVDAIAARAAIGKRTVYRWWRRLAFPYGSRMRRGLPCCCISVLV
jgi:AcrR family transcriptional regulator